MRSTPGRAPSRPRSCWPPGDARLAVDLRGGGMRRLVVGDWDVLDGYPAGARRRGLARRRARCPGRTGSATGAGPGAGRDLQLDVASPEAAERHARPGRLAAVDRARASARPASRVGTVLEPHAGLSVPAGRRRRLRARPGPARRSPCGCATSAPTPRPFGVGMHPYLHVGATRGRRHRRRRAHRPGPDGAGDRRRPAHRGAAPVRRRRRPDRRPRLRHPLTDLERDDDGWARRAAARPGRASSSSPSTSRGRGCRSTAATRCRTGSGGAASPSSR